MRFPLRKSGTYNIERIAALVKERADAARDAAERKRVVMDATANAVALANEVRAAVATSGDAPTFHQASFEWCTLGALRLRTAQLPLHLLQASGRLRRLTRR